MWRKDIRRENRTVVFGAPSSDRRFFSNVHLIRCGQTHWPDVQVFPEIHGDFQFHEGNVIHVMVLLVWVIWMDQESRNWDRDGGSFRQYPQIVISQCHRIPGCIPSSVRKHIVKISCVHHVSPSSDREVLSWKCTITGNGQQWECICRWWGIPRTEILPDSKWLPSKDIFQDIQGHHRLFDTTRTISHMLSRSVQLGLSS